MTNFVVNAANDALLNHISTNATFLHVCSGDPADRAAAIANSLGNVAVTGADFSLANGDVSGRKQVVVQKSITSASASGTAAVVALISGSVLLRKHDLTAPQAVTAGNPITVSQHQHEVRAPE
jgi:hypothetical protein